MSTTLKVSNQSKIVVEYAHCILATPGKLDVYPFYKYEMRSLPAVVKGVIENGESEYFVQMQDGSNRVFGYCDTAWQAINEAAYVMMYQSREDALNSTQTTTTKEA